MVTRGDGYSLNTYPQKDIYIDATGSVHFEVEVEPRRYYYSQCWLLKLRNIISSLSF
jgi:hypothetical protein